MAHPPKHPDRSRLRTGAGEHGEHRLDRCPVRPGLVAAGQLPGERRLMVEPRPVLAHRGDDVGPLGDAAPGHRRRTSAPRRAHSAVASRKGRGGTVCRRSPPGRARTLGGARRAHRIPAWIERARSVPDDRSRAARHHSASVGHAGHSGAAPREVPAHGGAARGRRGNPSGPRAPRRTASGPAGRVPSTAGAVASPCPPIGTARRSSIQGPAARRTDTARGLDCGGDAQAARRSRDAGTASTPRCRRTASTAHHRRARRVHRTASRVP